MPRRFETRRGADRMAFFLAFLEGTRSSDRTPRTQAGMNRLANPLAPRRALPEKTREIKAWVRELRGLDDSGVVSITELACRDDDCPDIETVVGIMRPGAPIETIRIHKAIADIDREDISHTPCKE